ncbi:MAG: fatty acid CoA ligase family protein, partial [Candidatus Adiutrix sp.]
FMSIIFGLFKAGMVPVMVDPGMGLRRMFRCLAEGAPSGMIGVPLAHILSLGAASYFPSIKLRITVGFSWPWGGASFAEILRSQAKQGSPAPPCSVQGDDTAAILFTSGSTGPAKGVVYTHNMFTAQIEAIKNGLNIQPGGIDLATFPLFGLFAPALGLTSLIPNINPGKPAKAAPRRIIEPLLNHQVTSMFASPTLLAKVGEAAQKQHLTFPSLQTVVSAGAPVPPRLSAQFSSLIPQEARLLTPYGATEGVPLTIIESQEIGETSLMTEKGLGFCVGRPLSGVKLAIIKISDQAIDQFSPNLCLPDGEIGEIIAQGPMVAHHYFERPKDNALSIIPDETGFWRRMGDVGWLDGQQRLWFCGRKNHRVVTEHGTLFSIPCEAVFNNHLGVRRAALVGVGPPQAMRPVMVIEPKIALSDRSFRDLTTELTALAKINPRTIHINTFLKHPSFPVDVRHNAKINREKLAIWAAAQLNPH